MQFFLLYSRNTGYNSQKHLNKRKDCFHCHDIQFITIFPVFCHIPDSLPPDAARKAAPDRYFNREYCFLHAGCREGHAFCTRCHFACCICCGARDRPHIFRLGTGKRGADPKGGCGTFCRLQKKGEEISSRRIFSDPRLFVLRKNREVTRV